MSTREFLDWLRSERGHLREEFKADVQGVYGSAVHGEEVSDSDEDFCVLATFLDGASLFDLVGLENRIEDTFHRKVHVVSTRGLDEESREEVMQDLISV